MNVRLFGVFIGCMTKPIFFYFILIYLLSKIPKIIFCQEKKKYRNYLSNIKPSAGTKTVTKFDTNVFFLR